GPLPARPRVGTDAGYARVVGDSPARWAAVLRRGDAAPPDGARVPRSESRELGLVQTTVAPRQGDRLEARVHAECSEDVADVVPHGLDAEMELGRDLVRRASLLEQP